MTVRIFPIFRYFPSELSFLSVDTRTPYVVDYPGEDGGKTDHYMLRWVGTTGEKGP